MSLTDRNGKAKDFNQLLEMAATLLQRAKTEAQAIDIGRLFNLSEEMVRALEKGPEAFKRAQEAAKSAGAVLDEGLVQKAKEFDKAWNETWSKFPIYAKAAAIEAIAALTPFGTWLERLFARIPGMAKAAVQAGGTELQSAEGAQDILDRTLKFNPDDQNAIRVARERLAAAQERDAEKNARARLAATLTQQEDERLKNRGVAGTQQFGPNLPDINDPKPDLAKTRLQKDQTMNWTAKRSGFNKQIITP
jgi:hypothetical protein